LKGENVKVTGGRDDVDTIEGGWREKHRHSAGAAGVMKKMKTEKRGNRDPDPGILILCFFFFFRRILIRGQQTTNSVKSKLNAQILYFFRAHSREHQRKDRRIDTRRETEK
jgi:hypothetical protein